MVMGIYQILNTFNGKKYIGSSSDVKSRSYRHKSLLRRGKHPNKHLQYSWDKHGENYFRFSLIEEVTNEDNLIERESYYFQLYRVFNSKSFYNILGFARRCKGNRTPLEEHHRHMISIGLKKFYIANGGSPKKGAKYDHIKRVQSEITRQRISSRLLTFYKTNDNSNKGRVVSKEQVINLSKKLKEGYATGRLVNPFLGKKHTKETKELLRKWNLGKKLTQDTKDKISIAFKGSKHPLYGKYGDKNPKYIVLAPEVEEQITKLYVQDNLTISSLCSMLMIKREVIRRTLIKMKVEIKRRNQFTIKGRSI
jgi:group I intron endonuclease